MNDRDISDGGSIEVEADAYFNLVYFPGQVIDLVEELKSRSNLCCVFKRALDEVVETLRGGEGIDLVVCLHEDQYLVGMGDQGLFEVSHGVHPVVVGPGN